MHDRSTLDWSQDARLLRWVQAGLLDEATAQALFAHELQLQSRDPIRRPLLGITLLGALALTTGVITLIAHNWAEIPNALKLLGLFLLLCGSGWTVWTQRTASAPSAKFRLDIALLVHAGFSLGSLALVSQIYQQGGPLWTLLVFWSALVFPLFTQATTRAVCSIWLVSLWCTLVSTTDEFSDALAPWLNLQRHELLLACLLVWFFGFLLSVVFLRSRKHPIRPAIARPFARAHIVALGLLPVFTWYGNADPAPTFLPLLLVCGAALYPALRGQGPHLGFTGDRPLFILLASGLLLSFLPVLLGFPSTAFGGFCAFFLFWSLFWYFAQQAHKQKQVRLAVTLLGLRIVIASFELFESLLITGLVLAACGATVLLLTRSHWKSADAQEKSS